MEPYSSVSASPSLPSFLEEAVGTQMLGSQQRRSAPGGWGCWWHRGTSSGSFLHPGLGSVRGQPRGAGRVRPCPWLARGSKRPQEGLWVSRRSGLVPLLFGTCCRLTRGSCVGAPAGLVCANRWLLQRGSEVAVPASRPTPWGPPHTSNQVRREGSGWRGARWGGALLLALPAGKSRGPQPQFPS